MSPEPSGDRVPDAALRSPERLSVLVVDDHDVVHWGIRLMLTQQPWVDRCLSAHSGEEAIELAVRYRPHVALVDLFIGEESGAEVCERLRKAEPLTRVLLFSGAGEISPPAARAAGASGFAYKDWPARKIAGAVRLVGLGKTVFDHQDRPSAMGLSDRERDVLNLMASGATNPEIAEQLHLSKHTVKEHTSAVYRKLGVRNRTEAVQRGQRLGLLGLIFYEPGKRDRSVLPHDPFKSLVAPRPIGWISTMDASGRVNLAPYSFFNAVGEGPYMLAFSSHGAKDSSTFAGELREFVWNLVTWELREQMNETSAPMPRGASEFERARLQMAPSRLVTPPRVAASPCAMECKVVHHLELRDLDGNTFDQHLVIGQVVGIHLDERAIAGEGIDTAGLRPIARCGGPADYTVVERIFQMRRPTS